MDILTFTVGDIQIGLPLNRLVLSFPVIGARLSVDQTGAGSIEATVRVVDLRQKFGFPISSSEQDTRLIMIESNKRVIGLVINMASQAIILRGVAVEPSPGINNPYVIGATTYDGDQVFLFDWDALLASDTVLELNEIFSQPMLTAPLPSQARFLEAVIQMVEDNQTMTPDQIRHMAETFDLPLSVASRLITFYRVV